MQCYLHWTGYILNNVIANLLSLVLVLFALLIAMKLRKKTFKKNEELIMRTHENQKEMISVLKEIRDYLKK